MSVAELNTKLDALKKDLFMLRMQHATNQLDIFLNLYAKLVFRFLLTYADVGPSKLS